LNITVLSTELLVHPGAGMQPRKICPGWSMSEPAMLSSSVSLLLVIVTM
jgi:hypothetical protein